MTVNVVELIASLGEKSNFYQGDLQDVQSLLGKRREAELGDIKFENEQISRLVASLNGRSGMKCLIRTPVELD